MKNILFITYFYPPVTGVGLPSVQRVSRFIRYLDTKTIHVLTMDPCLYPEYISINDNVSLPINNETIHRTGAFDFFKILLHIRSGIKTLISEGDKSEPRTNTESVLDKAKTGESLYQKFKDLVSALLTYPDFGSPWLFPAIIKGMTILRENKIDAVFATGMPWTSLIVGYCLKRLTGIKLIIDFQDPWVNNPFISKTKLEQYLDKKMESLILNKADLIVANTEHLKREMELRYENARDKLIVLSTGYDVEDFRNLPEVSLSGNKLTITHAGFLYLKRDPISILKAIQSLRKHYPSIASEIQFYQIGEVNLDYNLVELCREMDVSDHITIIGNMEHKTCLGYLAASHVLLVIQPGTKTQVPSKLYEYIYLNKPIITITEKDSALGRLIVDYGFGKVFEPDEYLPLADYLSELVLKKRRKQIVKPNYTSKIIFDARHIVYKLKQRMHEL